ncbi:unnamed protein product [Coregonus sp. 'balchen']|nr:unnamed protein product [Coregonus sp. 'balchen']
MLEVFILFCFCLIIGAAIGGLLHVWMVYSLNYQPFPSMVIACTWGCVTVLLLFFLHPVRCVLSISVPSLGIKQGRKILISTALVIVVTSCIPNMTRNLSRSVDMIKCSSHRTLPDIVNSDHIDLKLNFQEMFSGNRPALARLKAQFTAMQVRCIVLLETHVVLRAGLPVRNLFCGQACRFGTCSAGRPAGSLLFLRYLTDLKHDNVCQTVRLQELLRARGVEELPEAYRWETIWP